jgi:predicted PurR-regulated permease PerM
VVERLAAYAWRLLVLAAVLIAFLWLLGQLWVLLVAVVIGTLLTRALDPVNRWLRAHGVKPGLAALLSLVLFLGVLVLAGWVIIPSVADEFESLGPTLTEAVDDVEEWLVQDAPVDVSQRDVDRFRENIGDAISNALSTSGGSVVSGALVALEVFTGLLLSLVATFFLLKDGPDGQRWILDRAPVHRHDIIRRMAQRAWETIGGYLRGSGLLGVVEALIIGGTMAVAGAELVAPVMVLTLAAAFVPMVGAVVAGIVAVLVTLATAGFTAALIVGGVAIVVQQLDNDLLAPVIFGKALSLHPLIILFAVVGGGALFGFAGTVLAVPVTAVIVNVAAEAGLGQPRAPSPHEVARL